MDLNEIKEQWDKDCEIDQMQLDIESLKTPKLHNKYYKIFISEKMILLRLLSEMEVLKREKQDFYGQGPSKEQIDAGWELPAKGLILLKDIPSYINSDKDIINLSLRIGLQNEKVEYLKNITGGMLGPTGYSTRTQSIKNAIDFRKWTEGN